MGQLLLLLMLFTPLIGAVLIFGIGSQRLREVRQVSLLATLITLGCAVGIAVNYQTPAERMPEPGKPLTLPSKEQPFIPDPVFEIKENWMPMGSSDSTSAIQFHLGIDGLGLWLVVLTALLMVSAVLISWEEIKENPAPYYALLLLLETGMLGVFCAFDLILFYIFFEFTLLPLFFIIGIWGGPQKRYAARKFFIYTLTGSIIGLVGLVAVVLTLSSFDGQPVSFSISELIKRMADQMQVADAARLTEWRNIQWWIFLALFAGFAIKVPLFPFHTWLPLAHVEAPTAGSVLLAGVLLKLGTFGFLRLALPLLPLASADIGIPLIGWLAVIGIIYGSLCALAQTDIKKLVAYSSVSHLGFCMLGLFALNAEGISGGLLQMVNHGLSTGMLFLLVGMTYSRYHTRQMSELGGLAGKLPLLGLFWVFTCLSSAGLPGLNGFVGEFLCLLGMFATKPLYAVLGATGVVLGAWYLLTLLQRCFFGPLKEPEHVDPNITDLNRRELTILVPLAIACLWIGIYPKPFMDSMKPEVEALAKNWEKKVGR